MTTTYEPTPDDLALLDATALWLSDGQSKNFVPEFGFIAHGTSLLREPFEGAMAFAIMRRLRERGATVTIDARGAIARVNGDSCDAYREHPSSPLLALCRAMRDAGLLRTEPTIREVAQRVRDAALTGSDEARLARHILATEPER